MGRVAATNSSKKQLYYALIWLGTTLSLIIGLQLVGISGAAGDAKGFAPDSPPDFSLTAAEPIDEDSPSSLYSGTLWTINETRVEPGEGLLARATVDIDITLTNTLNLTPVRAPNSVISLISADGGLESDGRFVDAGSRLSIEPGESVDVTAQFTVGFDLDPPVETLALVVREPSRVPTVIPLAETGPVDPEVIAAAIDNGPETVPDPDDDTRQVVVEPASAAIGLNAGPYRALQGEKLVVVTVEVQRTENEPEALLETAFWGLAADGVEIKPVAVARSDRPAPNTDELTMLFSFPEAAESLALVAGSDSDDGAEFAIVVPRQAP